MSVRTLNKVASERDKAETKGYADLLVAAIPTEPLALYTFLIAGIVSTLGAGGDQRLTMRWIIFGVTAAFIAFWIVSSYLRRPAAERERKLPWPELTAAVVAFGAWGLVMPESPLMAELGGTDRTVWTFVITAAGVGLLGLLTGTMKKPAKDGAAGS